MSGATGAELRAEVVGRHAAADLGLQRLPTGRRVDDALHVERVDATVHAGEADGKNVHHEAGIYAGRDDAGAGLAAKRVILGRLLRRAENREDQLLTRGGDADAGLERWPHLRERGRRAGGGGMQDHVRSRTARKQGRDRIEDPRTAQSRNTGQFVQRATDLCRIDIHSPMISRDACVAANLSDSMPMGPRPNWATLMRAMR